MNLLSQLSNINEAEQLSERLREAGIVTHLSGVSSHMLSASRTGTLKIGVWVVLDKQFKDAEILMDNPNHTPAFPLSVDEMKELESNTYENGINSNQKILQKGAAWLVVETVVLTIVGYGFWFILARITTPEIIGTASAMISIATIFITVSAFGVPYGIQRF